MVDVFDSVSLMFWVEFICCGVAGEICDLVTSLVSRRRRIFSGVFSVLVLAGICMCGISSGYTMRSASWRFMGLMVGKVVLLNVVAVMFDWGRFTCATSSSSISLRTSLHSLSALSFPQTQGSSRFVSCDGVH